MLWLLIDATYLCHRSWHATGHLEHEGQAVGVSLGFLKTVNAQVDLHGADRVVFAFDYGGAGLRGQLRPSYKADRLKKVELSEEEKEDVSLFYRQVDKLRSQYLPAMGYKNIFRSKGYEGDDILAVLARDLPEKDEGVIITSDNDLWQCLRSNVRWYSLD